jgi:hypothetical protein
LRNLRKSGVKKENWGKARITTSGKLGFMHNQLRIENNMLEIRLTFSWFAG